MSSAVQRKTRRPIDLDGGGRTFTVMTPEGVALDFRLGDVADRIGAFLLDGALIALLLLGMGLMLRWLDAPAEWVWTMLAYFAWLLVPFYFMFFELGSAGLTPGKRRAGLRVVASDGGSLQPNMVITRNMVRLIEVHLPLTLLLTPEFLWGPAPGWTILIASLWLLGFMFMPLFNRERLRIGDMLGGTCVIHSPPTTLLRDLSDAAPAESAFTFTPQQLGVYGVYELQVLEHLLRQPRDPAIRDAMKEVAKRIVRKLDFDQKIRGSEVESFLRTFYRALRAHQEQRLLFGRRKEHKAARETELGGG